jgi:hypothetical protein
VAARHAAHATVGAMSAYPVVYQQTPVIERSRLTVFLRFIMVIPHLIWSFFYGIAATLAVFIAWFATVFTGRYPAGTYEFAGYLRLSTRLYAYTYLVTTSFPHSTVPSIPSIPSKRGFRRVKRATSG